MPLKVHLRSGDLLVLGTWRDLPGDSALEGTGQRYDVMRRLVGPFAGRISRDSIALLEATQRGNAAPGGSAILGTYTVLAGVVTVACLADPKSCFGSCPTFYLDSQGDRPVAEGFSGSVARSLQASDVDDLSGAHAASGWLALTMRNEALETHVVESVRLLAVERPEGSVVVADGEGRLHATSPLAAPLRCAAADGDCSRLVASRDGREWSTRVDSTDLARPDSLELIFPAVAGRAALVATARQTFVSTFVFYQSLAWAGSRAGELLAEVERRGITAPAWSLGHDAPHPAAAAAGARRPGARPAAVRAGRLALRRAGRGLAGPPAPSGDHRAHARGACRQRRHAGPGAPAGCRPVPGYQSRRPLSPGLPATAPRARPGTVPREHRALLRVDAPGVVARRERIHAGIAGQRSRGSAAAHSPGLREAEPGIEELFWASRFGGSR